jgi:hypothetical protein
MSKTFCPLPFTHLYIKPNGQYQPCCRFKSNKNLEYIHEHNSLDNLLNSSEFISPIREKMLAGETVKGCESCYLEEQSGGESMRTGEISRWGDIDKFIDKELSVTNIEITFGNYCNLACRTCGSNLSTSWEKDDSVLSKLYNRVHVKDRLNVKKNWIPEDFKNIEKFKITGGEPMLHPDFLSFLDDIINSGVSQNIEVQIFTNTSFVPKRHLLDRLSRFKEMGIWLSIDGTGDVQEYTRHNSKWDIVQNSARAWLEFENEFPNVVKVNFAPTISLYNAYNIIDMVSWFTELRNEVLNDPSTFTNCTWNITTWPYYMDIKLLPEKQKLIYNLKKYSTTITEHNLRSYKELIDRTIERLYNNGNKEDLKEFVQFNKDVDTLRNQDFVQTFPELYKQIKDLWDNIPGKL